MKAATLKEIKGELQQLAHKDLVELCIRLARFKKENKELLTYHLFEAADGPGYVNAVKETLADMFETVNKSNLYFAKKTLRKIVRTAARFIRYSDEPPAEADILIYCCSQMNRLGLDFTKSNSLQNLYNAQLKKIKKAIENMHPDLQYDYRQQLQNL